ncbi:MULTISPECIES: hypothetical protein [unclassified Acidovorax]|uniref:hypothetical protein n=1 Tax=unclassified Acidovorax TaxID=2684926 RepID=UPI0011B24285|nr:MULTISPECIES: hypothetical protein [unclassified Acidovorax]MCT6721432.1 hypothetical protein [Acidovorax sp. K2F]
MTKKIAFFVGTLSLFLTAWLFVGLDRYVGDHEVGSAWNPFIKTTPTFQVLFRNPAQYTLDRDPYDSLDSTRKNQFSEYCGIRYGIHDPHRCEEYIEQTRVK